MKVKCQNRGLNLKIKSRLAQIILVLSFTSGIQAQEGTLYQSGDDFNQLDINSILLNLHGSWLNSIDSNYLVTINNSNWTIREKGQDSLVYSYKLKKSIDNDFNKVLIISLLIKDKDWDSFKGKVNSEEALFYIVSLVEPDRLIISDFSEESRIELQRISPAGSLIPSIPDGTSEQ